jgi:hypothetical protein
MLADSLSAAWDTVVWFLTMFTLRTNPFGFLFCDGGHNGLKFGKRKYLSILRGDVRQE